jgi:hypothetical protein
MLRQKCEFESVEQQFITIAFCSFFAPAALYLGYNFSGNLTRKSRKNANETSYCSTAQSTTNAKNSSFFPRLQFLQGVPGRLTEVALRGFGADKPPVSHPGSLTRQSPNSP